MNAPAGCHEPKSSALRLRPAVRRLTAASLAIVLPSVLFGCSSPQRSLEDREKIVRAVLTLLTSTGKAVCIDDQTDGEALAVFREMMIAPRAARWDLRWHTPLPLRPDARNTTKDLKASEFDQKELEIREPGVREDALPGMDQLRLDGIAQRLSTPIGEVEESIAIRRSWVPANVSARWWPLNRLRKDCWPLFELSDSVRDRQTAFVTVRAEHWGTLYALEQTSSEWRVVAEWSRWLY